MVKMRVVNVAMVKLPMVRVTMAKRQVAALNLVILTETLARTVANVLDAVYPGYAFTHRQRKQDGVGTDALRGTYDIEASYFGPRPWAERHLQPVMSLANGAHLSALRHLTGGTREIAALGPFANRTQVATAFQSAALALGADSAACICPPSFADHFDVRVAAENAARAKQVINAAAHACGCQVKFGATTGMARVGEGGQYHEVSTVIVPAGSQRGVTPNTAPTGRPALR